MAAQAFDSTSTPRAGISAGGACGGDPGHMICNVASSPSFSKRDNNMFFRDFYVLFSKCWSTHVRQIKGSNRHKKQMRDEKARCALESCHPTLPGSEDEDDHISK